ncbi:MAG: cation-transporting P-type ATPase [Thermoproteota archaeon]
MRNVWELPPEEVFKEIGTTPDGLSKDEAERRLKEYGLTRLLPVKDYPPLSPAQQ